MRTTRLYFTENLCDGSTVQLDKNSSGHLIKVLRTKPGSPVILFNGDGFDYLCTTLDENPNKTQIVVDKKIENSTESNLLITLIQGLSRQDRMEATIQKSVELGVNKIIPVLCQRSNTRLSPEKQIKKQQHWKKIAISACEQSGRSVIPEIKQIMSFDKIDTVLADETCRIFLNPESTNSLKNIKVDFAENHKPKIEIFIGPEGGLNKTEIAVLKKEAFSDIAFGPRILRTETAGPAVISALQVLWGDF